MSTYEVTVEAVVRKTYVIEAEDAQTAQNTANEMFSVLEEPGIDEHYDQQVIDISEAVADDESRSFGPSI